MVIYIYIYLKGTKANLIVKIGLEAKRVDPKLLPSTLGICINFMRIEGP